MKMPNQWTTGEVIEFAKRVDKKTWVAVAIGSVVFFLVIVFLVFPAWIERPLLRRDVESMQAQIRQVNALSQKRAGWEKDEKILGALIEKTRVRVFTQDELGLLLGQVSKKASESRVDVLASKPMTEQTVFPAPYGAKYQPSGYEFTVQGGYHDIAYLASRIEGNEKLLRIQSLRIVASEKSPERHITGLKIWAFVVPPPSAVKAPAAGEKSVKQ